MTAQIIEKAGRKEYAVIPYKEFLRLQAAAEDYHALTELRKAKVDPANKKGRPFAIVASELGLIGKASKRTRSPKREAS